MIIIHANGPATAFLKKTIPITAVNHPVVIMSAVSV